MKVPQPLSRTLRQGGDTAHCELWIGQGWREETRDGDSHQRPEHGAGDQQHHDGRNGPGDFSDKSTCGTSPKAGWDCTITVSFSDLVKIGTVDSYQGKENRIIIVSLTRNNERFVQGFLKSPERINVSVSRAMERLVIVGASHMWTDANTSSPMAKVLSFIQKRIDHVDFSIVESSDLLGGGK